MFWSTVIAFVLVAAFLLAARTYSLRRKVDINDCIAAELAPPEVPVWVVLLFWAMVVCVLQRTIYLTWNALVQGKTFLQVTFAVYVDPYFLGAAIAATVIAFVVILELPFKRRPTPPGKTPPAIIAKPAGTKKLAYKKVNWWWLVIGGVMGLLGVWAIVNLALDQSHNPEGFSALTFVFGLFPFRFGALCLCVAFILMGLPGWYDPNAKPVKHPFWRGPDEPDHIDVEARLRFMKWFARCYFLLIPIGVIFASEPLWQRLLFAVVGGGIFLIVNHYGKSHLLREKAKQEAEPIRLRRGADGVFRPQ